jgi:hypothetical protein
LFFVNIVHTDNSSGPAHTVAWQTNTPTATYLLSAAKVFNITLLEVGQDVHEQVHNCANKNEEKANKESTQRLIYGEGQTFSLPVDNVDNH